MKWKCKYESQYMITKEQQNEYSKKYRMLKKRYKNGLIKIHDLTKQLDMEKKQFYRVFGVNQMCGTMTVWINCIFSNKHFTII